MTDSVDEHLSDRARQYANEQIGEDIDIGAMVAPPIPRDEVSEYTSDEPDDPIAGILYDLTDLALAVNHAGDVMLNRGINDVSYNATRETVAEVKIAHGALIASFNRALRTCAEKLGIDPDETDNIIEAIRSALGYTADATVEEDWTPLEPDDDA